MSSSGNSNDMNSKKAHWYNCECSDCICGNAGVGWGVGVGAARGPGLHLTVHVCLRHTRHQWTSFHRKVSEHRRPLFPESTVKKLWTLDGHHTSQPSVLVGAAEEQLSRLTRLQRKPASSLYRLLWGPTPVGRTAIF